jgi:rsbT co-antagonist protein RsbR
MQSSDSRIENVVAVLAKAACGEFTARVPSSDVEDAFLEVEIGVNLVMEELLASRNQDQARLKEIEAKNAEIADRQTMALRELATPIISVADGILTLPVIGTVDTERSSDMMDALLNRVVEDQASHVIIDITGVTVLDTRTADHFIRMAKAVRLLGASCFLTGISPSIAQTMAQLGIDTSGTRTRRRLADALKEAQRELADNNSSSKT